MYNVVKIGDKDVPMMSMASVDIFYHNIFHSDPLKEQVEAADGADSVGFLMRMGFVMAKYAECKDRKEMKKLNEDSYVEWLDQFDRPALYDAVADIQKTYEGQSTTDAEAKKNKDELTEE